MRSGGARPNDLRRPFGRTGRAGARSVAATRTHRVSARPQWRRPEVSPIEVLFWERAKPLIPELQREVEIRPYRVDFLVPSRKLIIELYGYKWHASQEKRISDAARERDLMRMGYRVMTFMGAEITRDVDRCVRQTSQMVRALAAESGPSTPTVLPRAEAVPVVVRAHQAQPDPEPVRHTESHPVPSTPLVAPPTRPRGRQKPPSAFGLSQVQIGVLIALSALFVVATFTLIALIGLVVATPA